jgi:tetratricopeptide (TPR) repeat protein
MWEKGQEALRQGETEQAILLFQQSLKLDPELANNHLSLAAAYVGLGQDEQAVPHFVRYLTVRPDHLEVRAHYAEVLLRLDRKADARAEFERFVADVQDHDELAREHLVHCHSRLMEIAEDEGDEYARHLHRGIGLYLLGCRRADLPEPEGELSVEVLWCQAAGELTLARRCRPAEARPCWYLYEVWSGLAQSQPAARALRAAESAAPLSYLTPAERQALQLACILSDLGRQRK